MFQYKLYCVSFHWIHVGCLMRMRVLSDAFLFAYFPCIVSQSICIFSTQSRWHVENALIALTVKFNWHLIESKCDVNWHEFVEIWCTRISLSIWLCSDCSDLLGKPLWFLLYFLLKSFFTIYAYVRTSLDERQYDRMNVCCKRYHKIGNDSTENKRITQNKHT